MDRTEHGVADGTRRLTRLDQADGGRVARLDYGTIGKVKRTPQGGLLVDANLTRTGVFPYRRADGSVRRELRLPEEVFKADSIATLAAAPLTEQHPNELVTPRTFKDVAVGTVGESPRRDGKFLAAAVRVQHEDTIGKVERGELREVSCGYTCRLEKTSGEHEGERYDAIQRDIEYNHVALVHKGRAGREVSLRLDAAEQVESSEDKSTRRLDAGDRETRTMKTMRIDGVDYEVGTTAFEQALERQQKRLDAELAEGKAARDKLQGQLDGLTKERDDIKKKLDAATDPTAIAEAVKARVALEADARSVLGDETKFDGKSDREVMLAAIRHDDDKFQADDKTSADYLRGRFESLVRKSREDAGIDGARRAARQAKRRDPDELEDERRDEDSGRRDDGAPDAERAYRRMVERNEKAHEQPWAIQRKGA